MKIPNLEVVLPSVICLHANETLGSKLWKRSTSLSEGYSVWMCHREVKTWWFERERHNKKSNYV